MYSQLGTTTEDALFNQSVEGVIALCPFDERPLHGLIGILDWHFKGVISQFLRQGFFDGKESELIYIPISHTQGLYHLFLLGCGNTPRRKPSEKAIAALAQNIKQLKINSVALSLADFGYPTEESLGKQFGKEVPLWIAP